MTDRISDRDLYSKLYNHNAYSNHPLDIDSLGAGGSKNHLVFFNTQNQLSYLMTNRELFDLLDTIGTYEYKTNQQRKTPVKVWADEYERIRDKVDYKNNITTGGIINNKSFTYDLKKSGMKPTIKNPIGVMEIKNCPTLADKWKSGE